MIRAIATDLDGTLTDERQRISLNAIEAMRQVEARGIPVVLATGNVLPITRAVSVYMGTSAPVVAENGGIVHWPTKGRTKVLADRKRCDEALRHLQREMDVKPVFTDPWRVTEVALEPDADVKKIEELLADWDLLIEATGFAVHISNPGINKLEGVRIACSWMDISLGDVMAIGDSANDLSMIEGCGVGVAVANASPQVKASADHVTHNKGGDGVVEALQRYLP